MLLIFNFKMSHFNFLFLKYATCSPQNTLNRITCTIFQEKKMIRLKIEELKVIIFLIIGKKTYLTIKMILKYSQILIIVNVNNHII